MVNNIIALDPSVPVDRKSVHAPDFGDPKVTHEGPLNGRVTFNIWNHIIPYNLLRDIWNGPRYQDFRRALLSDAPPSACSGCGLRWSL